MQRPKLHHSIRKYTLAMLETFNGLFVEIEDKNQDNENIYKYKQIPIKYKSREKLNLFDEIEEKNLLSGNYNVLPRTSLALVSIIKNNERQSNKFCKIATTNFGEFLYNAVSYDFSYDMSVMCRGMNEASNIIEQIASKFNPTYTLLINEIPNQITPTSCPIQLIELTMEDTEYEELSTNIVIVTASFILKGNFYEPVREMKKIKHYKMFLNMWHHSIENEMNRAKLYDFDVIDSIPEDIGEDYDLTDIEGQFGNIQPVITDIITSDPLDEDVPMTDTIQVNEELGLICELHDYDNKWSELFYTWDVNGSAIIYDNPNSEITDGSRKILKGNATETIEVKCIVQDVHGNSSNMFIKQITVV